jgi:hypothetical protein
MITVGNVSQWPNVLQNGIFLLRWSPPEQMGKVPTYSWGHLTFKFTACKKYLKGTKPNHGESRMKAFTFVFSAEKVGTVEILVLKRVCLCRSGKYFWRKKLAKSLLISTLDKVITTKEQFYRTQQNVSLQHKKGWRPAEKNCPFFQHASPT